MRGTSFVYGGKHQKMDQFPEIQKIGSYEK